MTYMALDRSAADILAQKKISCLAQLYSKNGPPKKWTKIWCNFLLFLFPSIFFISPKRAKNVVFLLKQAQNIGGRLVSRHISVNFF